MNGYLLDTRTLIDWAINPSRLGGDVFFSAISAVEIAIKQRIGTGVSKTAA
ncbi:MAG: hypothetical protein AAGG48_18235 [Planctomycetota bacterium]